MEVSPERVHKVTLVLRQHAQDSLQLGQSEALLQSASSLEGSSRSLQKLNTLKSIGLQAGLPKSGPETHRQVTFFFTVNIAYLSNVGQSQGQITDEYYHY